MLEVITLNLGPILGFVCTVATVVFIAWGAPRTHREGGLEALRPPTSSPDAPAATASDAATGASPDA